MVRHWIVGAGCATAILIAAAAPVSAAPKNLVGQHGEFEKPVLRTFDKSFGPGSRVDGWQVSTATVSIASAFPGVMVPPQGKQDLSLNDASGAGGDPAGKVCRAVASVAGHHYKITFFAGVANTGSPRVVVSLGSASKAVVPPPGADPTNFKSFSVVLPAAAAHADVCFTATKIPADAFPLIDAVRVVDAGS